MTIAAILDFFKIFRDGIRRKISAIHRIIPRWDDFERTKILLFDSEEVCDLY